MRLRLILLSIIFETIPVSPQKIDLNLSIDLQTFKKHGFPDRRQLDNRREFCNGICSSLKFCHREAKNFERKSIVKLDCNSVFKYIIQNNLTGWGDEGREKNDMKRIEQCRCLSSMPVTQQIKTESNSMNSSCQIILREKLKNYQEKTFVLMVLLFCLLALVIGLGIYQVYVNRRFLCRNLHLEK